MTQTLALPPGASMFRLVPDGHGGHTRALCLSGEAPRIRQVSAAAQDTAELPIADLADETLTALANDSAVPSALRAACKTELKTRDAGGDKPVREPNSGEAGSLVAASFGRSRSTSALVRSAERRAREFASR